MSLLLDTGVIYAFLNRRDANHAEALELIGRVSDKEFGVPYVTDQVINELFTLIRARTSSATLEEAARLFLPLPAPTLKGLSAISLGPAVLEPAWQVFRKYRDHRLSFTDATMIVTMREMRLRWLATFDSRLKTLVPFTT